MSRFLLFRKTVGIGFEKKLTIPSKNTKASKMESNETSDRKAKALELKKEYYTEKARRAAMVFRGIYPLGICGFPCDGSCMSCDLHSKLTEKKLRNIKTYQPNN